MKIHRVIFAAALAAAAIPASATSTMCMFEGSSGASSYSVEFIGYGEIAMIQMNLSGGPRSLPEGSYEVMEFDQRNGKIDLVYRNPGDPSLPPSFTLVGARDNVRMTIGKERIVGELNCDF
jgi:hypothetical protein